MDNLPPEESPYGAGSAAGITPAPQSPDPSAAAASDRLIMERHLVRRGDQARDRAAKDDAKRQVADELRRVRAEGAQFNHPVLTVPPRGSGGQNLPLVEFTFSISNGEFVTYSIPAR